MLHPHIALVSEDSAVTTRELQTVADALQKQVMEDFGPVWNISATVSAFSNLDDLPLGSWPILLQDTIGVAGAGGFHDQNQQPFARVLYSPDTSAWTLAASHELLEMLVDPSGNRLITGPSLRAGQSEVQYLVEVCDPCEALEFAYFIGPVLVSDFYTPAYFDANPKPGGAYDFRGHMSAPRQVLEQGYISWFEPVTQSLWQLIMEGGQQIFKRNGWVVDETRMEPESMDPFSDQIGIASLRGFVDRLTSNPSLGRIYRDRELARTLREREERHALARRNAARMLRS